MNQSFFSAIASDPIRRQSFEQLPAAKTKYVIHFTPRSGSSWLTDILSATGRLGRANEVFNPGFIPKIAQAVLATDMESYIDLLPRRLATKGVFSAEVTAHQIGAVFGHYGAFHRAFGTDPCFWLIRQDIVAQAVSLAKMVTTNVAHFKQESGQHFDTADALFSYDGVVIRRWLDHVRSAEKLTESWISNYGLIPLRMSYEQTTALTPHQMVNVVARHLGLPDIPLMQFAGTHKKLGNAQNTVFASRFRTENAAFVAELEDERKAMLAHLDPIQDLVRDLAV